MGRPLELEHSSDIVEPSAKGPTFVTLCSEDESSIIWPFTRTEGLPGISMGRGENESLDFIELLITLLLFHEESFFVKDN